VVSEERHDSFVVIGGDDEVQVRREASLELADGVAAHVHEADIGLIEFFENLDECLAAFFLAHG